MTYTRTLLAGAAICALCTAPALAAKGPGFHLATSGFDSPSKLTKASPLHSKSNAGSPDGINETLTYSFSASLSKAADYKVPVQFAQYTWQNTIHCKPPMNESFGLPARTAAAKLGVGTTTGPTSACPSATFTFYGPLYELNQKHATSDSFRGVLRARRYYGYNLRLVEDWSISIGA